MGGEFEVSRFWRFNICSVIFLDVFCIEKLIFNIRFSMYPIYFNCSIWCKRDIEGKMISQNLVHGENVFETYWTF